MTIPDSPITTPADAEGGERIAKRLARAGLCSRRDAERWIAEGRVAVNGTVLSSPACVLHPGDVVLVDGKVVPEPEPARLWRYHKPSGLVTTARDEKGRATVFEKLPPEMPRVISVGRLDLTTEGLLLLTNDGELARFLELPATGWTRRYRVRVFGEVDEVKLADLGKGPTIEGVKYGPIEALLDRVQGRNAWLTVSLKEGKNREIRKVMEALGLQVNRLIRVAYGPFQLGKLEEGAVEEVPKRVVREQVSRFFTGAEPEAESKPKPAGGAGKPSAPLKSSGAAKAAAKTAPPSGAAKPRDAKAGWAKAAPEPKTGPARRGAPAKSGAAKSGPANFGGAKAGPTKAGPAKAAPAKAGPVRPGPAKPGGGPQGPKPRGPGKPGPAGRGGAGGGASGGRGDGGRGDGGRGGGAGARTERGRADRRR